MEPRTILKGVQIRWDTGHNPTILGKIMMNDKDTRTCGQKHVSKQNVARCRLTHKQNAIHEIWMYIYIEHKLTYVETRNWLWSGLWFSIIFVQKVDNFIVVFIQNFILDIFGTTSKHCVSLGEIPSPI